MFYLMLSYLTGKLELPSFGYEFGFTPFTETLFLRCSVVTFGILHDACRIRAMVETLSMSKLVDSNFKKLVHLVISLEAE
jgi:hypothetical protein